ncbi:MAG: heavy metal translocating P-type ATPase, partial [Methylococcaceae bacterium]|nr:heavy metal translocating P-type ATPase [Methylococcaceae bacterium]
MATNRQLAHAGSPYNRIITLISLIGIGIYLLISYAWPIEAQTYALRLSVPINPDDPLLIDLSIQLLELPLYAVLLTGGVPLIMKLGLKFLRGNFGADLLAGTAIVTAMILGENLAGCLVILMLSGGATLEQYAVRKASSVLEALAKRMPDTAHRQCGTDLIDIRSEQVKIGDTLLILPHEICPVDGTVLDGVGTMDESYLTGEPYLMSKTQGSKVLSGAINGDSALSIRADKLAIDSRYAKIMDVMRSSEQYRPNIRRLGDKLGALYTPIALIIAIGAWLVSQDILRFLAVLVVATPCPLLIGIPVTIISSISLAARREIIIKNPAILETIGSCRTAIFDKTGTLTYGRPNLTALLTADNFAANEVLALVASLERYSKHPLSTAIIKKAESLGLTRMNVSHIAELPGQGLLGEVSGKHIQITSRKQIALQYPFLTECLPPSSGGLECIVLIDEAYAATLQFRDEVRIESPSFISHLRPKHLFEKLMLVSGDRESEVRYLADQVGIEHVYFSQSPEQKLAIVRRETELAKTVYVG